MHPSGRGLYTSKETHNDLKNFKVDVIKKGFRRPVDIPIYHDSNLSTYRGGSDIDDSPPRSRSKKRGSTHFDSATIDAVNIKTAGGFKKKK